MNELQAITELIKQAGKIALGHFRKVKPAWKANNSYVTAADLEVQAYIRSFLENNFPDDGMIGEEDGLRKQPDNGSKRTWVIDPIDGTASFTAGLPVWGIAIGLLVNQQPAAGYFYMPATGDLFSKSLEGDAERNHEATRINHIEDLHPETCILSISEAHRYYSFDRAYPGKVRSLGSSIGHICYAATGSADAAIIGKAYIWDIVAGDALLRANGGELRYFDGSSFSYAPIMDGSALTRPLIAGHPDALNKLIPLITVLS